MKYIHSIELAIITFSLIFTACENTMDFQPDVDLLITPNPAIAGEPVEFTLKGNAELYSLYTGDAGHEWSKSYAVITEGKEVDREYCWLTREGLDSILATNIWVNDTIDYKTTTLEPILGRVFNSSIEAQTFMNLQFASYINNDGSMVLSNIIANTRKFLDYFTYDKIDLEPEGGFSTGVAITRATMTTVYTYPSPGTYVVVVIATNIGQKEYSGSGYIDDRNVSVEEYPVHRCIKEYTLVVQ